MQPGNPLNSARWCCLQYARPPLLAVISDTSEGPYLRLVVPWSTEFVLKLDDLAQHGPGRAHAACGARARRPRCFVSPGVVKGPLAAVAPGALAPRAVVGHPPGSAVPGLAPR